MYIYLQPAFDQHKIFVAHCLADSLYSWSFFGLRLYSTVDSLQWHIGESKCRTWLSLFTVRRFTAISGHVSRIVVSRSLSISSVDSWSTFLSFYMSSQNANSLIVINYSLHKVVFQHFILFCFLIFVLMFPLLVVEQFKQSLTASSVVTHYHSIVHWLDHFVGLVWSVGRFWSISAIDQLMILSTINAYCFQVQMIV